MVATHSQHAPADGLTLSKIANLAFPTQTHFTPRSITHRPKAGLNPVVDACAYLFSVLGKLKQLVNYRHLNKLQAELLEEIAQFQETLKNQGYNPEYIVACRYILSATFDDIIANTRWGGSGQWESYSLLTAQNQETHHQDKFFTILERIVKEPSLYINVMELIYICLSMGYKGQYRGTEYNQYQLEQITLTLYKHIRAFRGNISKTLSPTLATAKSTKKSSAPGTSPLFIYFVSACIVMTIFVSLGYLMDVISNESYKTISGVQSNSNAREIA